MSETKDESNSWRAHVAERNRRQALEDREHKYAMAIIGILVYSAFANFLGAAMLLATSTSDAVLGVVLGILYSIGVYRVWQKDDTRWWPVAVPAGATIAVLSLAWFGGLHRPLPVILNIALLALVPIRARANAAITKVGVA